MTQKARAHVLFPATKPKHQSSVHQHIQTPTIAIAHPCNTAITAAHTMVSRKEMAREDGAAVPTASAPPPTPVSKLPGYVRFPLLIVLSLATSMSLLSAASEFMDPQLRAVCHSSNEDAKVVSSIAWKLTELSLGWFGNFDGKPGQVLELSKELYASYTL